jgi:DNA-binding MarR family transcriptional regulator
MPPEDENDTTARAMNALRSIVRAVVASAHSADGRAKVSGAQLFALRQISISPGMSVNDLASRTLARQSTVSELVTRLVKNGLVARKKSGSDARQAELTLTAAGKRAITRSRETAQEKLIAGLGALSRKKREQVADALEEWLDASGLSDVPPTMLLERAGKQRQ